MPQIDFYITKATPPLSTMRTACRVAEKAFQAGLKIHLKTSSKPETEKLDSLLWTFRDRSFIPHQIFDSSKSSCMVTLSADNGPDDAEILINLCDHIPDNFEQFKRIVEIIDNKDASVNAGRKRYRFYREKGYKPNHHEVFSD